MDDDLRLRVRIDHARVQRVLWETFARLKRLPRSKRKAERARFERRIAECVTATVH